ncbi:hypothetical protein N665_1360s0005 [Sinapis alba]|nr:hypothetical protein N665_1360s0005 [Sinapis alba]
MEDINYVVDLKSFKTLWKIKLLTYISYSLLQHGDKIYATVQSDLVAKFYPYLREGFSNILMYFYLNCSSGFNRTTNHAYKINFLSATRVGQCEELASQLSGFEPVKYVDLISKSLKPDYLIDIIGQVVEESDVEHVYVKGKDIDDLFGAADKRLLLELWGKFASDVSETIQNVEHAHCTICMFLPKDDLRLVTVESTYFVMGIGCAENTDEKCILMCTIAAINFDMGCFYLSCKQCAKKVLTRTKYNRRDANYDDMDKQIYYCLQYKVYNPHTLRSNTKLLIMGNQDIQLLNQSSKYYAEPSNKLEVIHETDIGMGKDNFLYSHETYKVLKLIKNRDIIFSHQDIIAPAASEDSHFSGMATQSDAPKENIFHNSERSVSSGKIQKVILEKSG